MLNLKLFKDKFLEVFIVILNLKLTRKKKQKIKNAFIKLLNREKKWLRVHYFYLLKAELIIFS